jgi:hypothetical protein
MKLNSGYVRDMSLLRNITIPLFYLEINGNKGIQFEELFNKTCG